MIHAGASYVTWPIDSRPGSECRFVVTPKEIKGGPRKSEFGVCLVDVSSRERFDGESMPHSYSTIWNLQNTIYPEEAIELADSLIKAAEECKRLKISKIEDSAIIQSREKRGAKKEKNKLNNEA